MAGGRSDCVLAHCCVLWRQILFGSARILLGYLKHSILEKVDTGSTAWPSLLNHVWIVI